MRAPIGFKRHMYININLHILQMHMHTQFYTHICIFRFTHATIYIYIYVEYNIYIYIHILTFIDTYTYTHAYVQACSYKSICIPVYTALSTHRYFNIHLHTYIPTYYLPTYLPILLHAERLHLCASQVEAAQSRRLLSLEETVMLRDRKISELQAQVAERQWPWREAKR